MKYLFIVMLYNSKKLLLVHFDVRSFRCVAHVQAVFSFCQHATKLSWLPSGL
jgi:hypothetical protein